MDIGTILTGVSGSIEIVKALRGLDNEIKTADMKIKLANLLDQLLDSKSQLIEAKDEMLALKHEKHELQKALREKESMVSLDGLFYQLDDENHETPFCPNCFQSDPPKKIKLKRIRDEYYRCPVCNIYPNGQAPIQARPRYR